MGGLSVKRAAAFLLSLVLLVPALALEENLCPPFSNHEIWSIPWGTPFEEFFPLAYEKTGITFIPSLDEGYYGEIIYETDRTQSISILGYPTDYIRVYFLRDTKRFSGISVFFDYRYIMPDSNYTLPMYLNLWNQLMALYGNPTTLAISPFTLDPDEDYPVPPEIPLKGDQFDMARYLEFLEEYRDVDFIIETTYQNISLCHTVSTRNGTPCYFINLSADYYDADEGYPFPELGDEYIDFPRTTIHLGF